MKSKFKITLFGTFLILITSCQYRVREIDLDLEKMCVSVKNGEFSEIILMSIKGKDTSYLTSSCSLIINSNTVCFRKQLDSLNRIGTDDFRLFITSNDNAGEHIFQYGFKTSDSSRLSKKIIIKEIIE